MKRIRNLLSIAAMGLALCACAADGHGPDLATMEAESSSPAPPALFDAHLSALSRRGPEGPTLEPVADPDLEAMTREVQAVRDDMDAMLRDPARAALFRDFRSEESRALQEIASDEQELRGRLRDGLDLAEIRAFLFARSPRIAAARQRLRAMLERYPQVVYVETLVSQYSAFLADLMLGAGKALHRDPVEMKHPSPGVLSLKADLVSRDVDLARWAFEKVVRDQVVAGETALFDLWYVDRALASEREVLRYLRQLEKTISSRMETARAEKSQVLQVQVEISALENDLITLDQRRSRFRAKIRELLNLAPDVPLGAALVASDLPALPGDTSLLYARARRGRQEIRIARDRVRRVDTVIALAKKMTYPDFTLGLGYFRGIRPGDRPDGRQGVLPDGFGGRGAGARTFWFGQEEAFLREIRETRRALQSGLEAERREAEYLVRAELFLLDESRRKISLYQDVLLSQARQAYEDTLAGYRSDRVEFLNVIDTLRQWLRFDLERERALRDYLKSRVRLEAAVGERLAP